MPRLVILGGGESGVGTAILGKKKGYDVFVSDFGKIKENYREVLIINGIQWEDEQHTEALILNADVVMKSPGIPDKTPIIKKVVRKTDIPVISEIEFASQFTNAITIGITGSNGKDNYNNVDLPFTKARRIECRIRWKHRERAFAWQVAEENYDVLCFGIKQFSIRRNHKLQTTYCHNYKYKSRSFR